MIEVIERHITEEQIKRYSDNFRSEKDNIAIANAVAKSGINAVSFNNEALRRLPYRFSLELEHLKITNQKSSGRCWLFAGLNVLRQKTVKKLNVENFEFSECYLAFWDKFEHANHLLEIILRTLDEPIGSRILDRFLQYAMDDGGFWQMFVSLVQKYGVVPKEAMPETFHSSNTVSMINLSGMKMREYAMELRELHQKGMPLHELRLQKDRMLDEMYTFFCIFYGEPPAAFDFEYRDKDKAFHYDRGITPHEFYHKYVGMDLDEYMTVANYPMKERPFNRTYISTYFGNVIGGKELILFNTDLNTMKSVTVSQLKDGEAVWFAADEGKMFDRETGMADSDLYRYDLALDMTFRLAKGERVLYKGSGSSHAMAFTGVNLVDDIPNRWKVENSWGEDKGEKGFFVLSDKWFDEYVYQVIVNKKHLPAELLPLLDQKPIELMPWDWT